jgi:hypothetical protein
MKKVFLISVSAMCGLLQLRETKPLLQKRGRMKFILRIFVAASLMLLPFQNIDAQKGNVHTVKIHHVPSGNGYEVDITFKYQFIWCYGEIQCVVSMESEKALAYHYNGKRLTEREVGAFAPVEQNRSSTMDISATLMHLNLRCAATCNKSSSVKLTNLIYAWGGCFGDTHDFFCDKNWEKQFKDKLNEFHLTDFKAVQLKYTDHALEYKLEKEEETKKKAEEAAKKKAEDEAKKKAEEDAKKKAEEEARKTAEAKKKAEEETGKVAESKKKEEDSAKQQAAQTSTAGSGGDSRSGANGSDTPVYDSRGLTYRVTNPATGEVRYFDSEQKQKDYMQRVKAQQDGSSQSGSSGTGSSNRPSTSAAKNYGGSLPPTPGTVKTADGRYYVAGHGHMTESEYARYKSSYDAQEQRKAQQQQQIEQAGMAIGMAGGAMLYALGDAIDRAAIRRRNRREKQASDMFNKALDNIQSGNCSEQTIQNLATVSESYGNTLSAGAANYLLGTVYESNECGQPDYAAAYAYYRLAAEKKYNGAQLAVNTLQISESDLRKGKKLYRSMRDYIFLGYSGDTRSPFGIALGGLKHSAVGIYTSIRFNMMLFKKETDDLVPGYGTETFSNNKDLDREYREDGSYIDRHVYETTVYWQYDFSSMNEKRHGRPNCPNINVNLGITKRFAYPVWIYAGMGVNYNGKKLQKVDMPKTLGILDRYEVKAYTSEGELLWGGRDEEYRRETEISTGYIDTYEYKKARLSLGLEGGLIYHWKLLYVNAGLRTDFKESFMSFGAGFAF